MTHTHIKSSVPCRAKTLPTPSPHLPISWSRWAARTSARSQGCPRRPSALETRRASSLRYGYSMHPEVKRRRRDRWGGYIGDEGKMRGDKMQQHKCEASNKNTACQINPILLHKCIISSQCSEILSLGQIPET